MSEIRAKELEFKLELLKELYKIAIEQTEIKGQLQLIADKQGDCSSDIKELITKLNIVDKQLLVVTKTLTKLTPKPEADMSHREENIELKKIELENVKNKRAVYLAVGSAVVSSIMMIIDKISKFF